MALEAALKVYKGKPLIITPLLARNIPYREFCL